MLFDGVATCTDSRVDVTADVVEVWRMVLKIAVVLILVSVAVVVLVAIGKSV